VLKRGAFFSRWQVQQKESCKKSQRQSEREREREREISTPNLTSCKISTEKQNPYDKEEGRKKAQLSNLLPETLRMLAGPTLLKEKSGPTTNKSPEYFLHT
jgi:hypothetical protein